MRAIRLFIKEGEGAKGKGSGGQGAGAVEKAQKESVTYQIPEPASALVREEEFAKQLRIARYLAGASLVRPREIEKAGEKAPSLTKPKPRAKAHSGNKKGVEAELARERRQAQHLNRQKVSSPGRGRREKRRDSPER